MNDAAPDGRTDAGQRTARLDEAVRAALAAAGVPPCLFTLRRRRRRRRHQQHHHHHRDPPPTPRPRPSSSPPPPPGRFLHASSCFLSPAAVPGVHPPTLPPGFRRRSSARRLRPPTPPPHSCVPLLHVWHSSTSSSSSSFSWFSFSSSVSFRFFSSALVRFVFRSTSIHPKAARTFHRLRHDSFHSKNSSEHLRRRDTQQDTSVRISERRQRRPNSVKTTQCVDCQLMDISSSRYGPTRVEEPTLFF